MTSIGVVEHRRSFLPDELKVCRQNFFFIVILFFRTTYAFILPTKREKKPIIILSSLHKHPEVLDDEKKLPCVVHDYNQTKCGADANK